LWGEKIFSSFIITFREALEAALIIGIILGYLAKTKQEKYNKIVYVAIAAAIMASIIGAITFNSFAGGFEGVNEQIFEGITMLIGAVLITTMILWMMKQKNIASDLKHGVETEIHESQRSGLFLLVFISILREGIETVLFLGAASFVSSENNILGALLGIAAAILLGYLMFVGSMKIDLKKFFNISSILLILFAAGLVAHGMHELAEAKIVPEIIEHVWDINPSVNADGSYPALHENGIIGSFLKGLFGYNGNPSLIEIISYVIYLVIVFILWKRTEREMNLKRLKQIK